MRNLIILTTVAVVGLSACTAPRPTAIGEVDSAQVVLDTPIKPDGTVRGTTRSCDPNNYSSILGQDESIIPSIEFPGEIRVIRPGDNLDPRDFDPDRLSISVREDGSIRAVVCG